MTEYAIPDRTTTEVLNASPLLLYRNLVENLQNHRHWRGFYADEYTAENGLHVHLVCGVTSAFIREDSGDQYGFVVRIVDVGDVHTKVFITSSYANTRDNLPASMPDAGEHDLIAETLLAFCTRKKQADGVIGSVRRFFSFGKQKTKGI